MLLGYSLQNVLKSVFFELINNLGGNFFQLVVNNLEIKIFIFNVLFDMVI